jgi:uncharacterized phage-associated protein
LTQFRRRGLHYAVSDQRPKFSEEKMQQVILYFLEHINNVHLGRTKLMKLLYFVDFDHAEKYGRPLTGAAYRKLPHGPYPKDAEKLIKRMEKKGLVKQIKVASGDFGQHRLITLGAKFDPNVFTGAEMRTLEKVATDWADATASQIEAATHAEAPWAGTQDGKLIDYEMAEYRTPIGVEPLDEALGNSKALADYLAALA